MKYFTNDAAAQLIYLFVTSRLCNLNYVLYGLPDYLIDKLQLIQNNAAHIISRLQCSVHITPELISLHWLLVRYGIWYKIMYTCHSPK